MSSHGDSRRSGTSHRPNRSHAAPSSTSLPASSSPASSTTSATEQHLKKLLIAIGEQSVNSVEKNLSLLSTTLLAELPQHRAFILSTLLHCIKALPSKHAIFASLTSLIALHSPPFATDLLALLAVALPHSIVHSQRHETRILLRFLACLAHTRIISIPSLYTSLLTPFLAFIDAAPDSTHRDYHLYTLISTLPWLAVEHHSHTLFTALLSSLALRMQQRPPPPPSPACSPPTTRPAKISSCRTGLRCRRPPPEGGSSRGGRN